MAQDDNDWLQIQKEQAVAYGKAVDGRFIVRQGSTTMREGSPHMKRDRPERDRLVEQGVLVPDENPALFRFSADHIFNSPSRAAGVVIDGNSNGDHWRPLSSSAPWRDQAASAFTRAEIEEAMDAFDRHGETGSDAEIFTKFEEPRDYWVRSSRERRNRIYPTKPIVGYILKKAELNGGWGQKADAAARLHNSGFIIVDKDDKPVPPPERYDHLIRDVERIRLCALNYFIEPARERSATEVAIRASQLAEAMGLVNVFSNICNALGGKKFQLLAHVPPPTYTEPNPSSSTIFTFKLASQAEAAILTEAKSKPLRSATNLILYGPPGTGKTYQTAWEAVRLCLGDQLAEKLKGPEKRKELMAEYRRLMSEGRIEFVTFHQSMSYEEFVEGLRPTTGDDAGDGPEEVEIGNGFRLIPCEGVFKRVSERARLDQGVGSSSARLDRSARVFKVSLGKRYEQDEQIQYGLDNSLIHLGWGGDIDWSDERFDVIDNIVTEWRTRKDPEATRQSGGILITFSFRADMRIGDYVVISDGLERMQAFGRVTGEYYYDSEAEFHPHRRPVEWLWRGEVGIERSRIYSKSFRRHSVYKLQQPLLNWDALEEIVLGDETLGVGQVGRDYVLIIDEINRANISKVFGELITLLEPDKRLGMENEIRLVLPYSKKLFGVPANLHIVGTMNTADRSIALLDTALRRRFTFRELMPDPLVLSNNVGGINLQKLLTTINDRIEYLFDREHQIGHAYFTSCANRDDVEEVMRHKVIPLLAEYFYEDWSKVATVLGDTRQGQARFLEAQRLVAPVGMTEEDFTSEKQRWSVKASFDFSEFAL